MKYGCQEIYLNKNKTRSEKIKLHLAVIIL
jgi:hypothetical protein